MDRKLGLIMQKIVSIQAALIRFRDEKEDKQRSLQVRVAFSSDNLLHCVVTGEIPVKKIKNRTVHLIQKHHDDYFFISGSIDETQDNSRIVSVDINRACWFVRKKRGDVTWLREKYIYEAEQKVLRPAS